MSAPVLSLTIQFIGSLFLLVTGAADTAAGLRDALGDPYHRAAWRLTGATFLVEGSAVLAHNAFGSAAMAAGAGSALMQRYLLWLPILNHSRTFMVTGALVALGWLALLRRPPGRGFWTGFVALLCVGAVAGAFLGYREGPFTRTAHLTALALWDLLELLVILPMLFVLLVTNRVDRLLWALYAAYACSLALGIFWYAVLGQIAPQWTPPIWTRTFARDVLYAVMVAAAAWRWRASRRSIPVHGMLGPPRLQVPMLR